MTDPWIFDEEDEAEQPKEPEALLERREDNSSQRAQYRGEEEVIETITRSRAKRARLRARDERPVTGRRVRRRECRRREGRTRRKETTDASDRTSTR